MVCSSSFPASVDISLSNHTYGVFLSFRGEDTRNSFTGHLYEALLQAGIRTFRDDDEINRGEQLKPELEKAIIDSRGSIVVISESYAKSRWCLDELCLILEQRKKCNHFVLPVFYRVDPSHVRNQEQSFSIEAKEGVDGLKWSEVKVNRWKAALTEVANLTGMVVTGYEPAFIAKIVNSIDSKLDLKLLSIQAHLTGIETRAEGINNWLKNEQSNASALAICGMGGSGKTTLARYIYNSNKQDFDGSSFLEDIGTHHQQPHGLFELQKQLLTDIFRGKNIRISSVSEGTSKIEEALQMKRVLIVLDDIDEYDQLAALLGTKKFHTQSKIIITSRLLNLHERFLSISQSCEVHKLELLDKYESLELLSCHAFGSKIPMEDFEDLTVQLARYCEGNPLALTVLGSSLFVSPGDRRKIYSMKLVWESTLESLNSLKGDVHSKIQSVLLRSFNYLPFDSQKELFLHIACFFVGADEDYAVKILEHDWHAKAGITTLINRCLLTISESKTLVMHQLLQDMGRKIVCEESKDPGKRTRIWSSDEAYRVLTIGDGSKTIEGLSLSMQKLKKGTKALALKTGSLAKINKLKLLQLNHVELTGSYKSFPELRWLFWHACHLKSIPSGLLMSSLVAIDMSYGNIEKFEPTTVLDSLKILNLEGCYKLVSVRNLDRLPNLECLNLSDCSSLTHLCKTIRGLEKLSVLNLIECSELWKHDKVFSLPHSLNSLSLAYCDLEHNSDLSVVFNGLSLSVLNLVGNLIAFLPSNIDFKMLRVLNVSSCPNLTFLRCLPSTLEELYTYHCKSLVYITFQSSRFKLLKFGYGGCYKLNSVEGLFKFALIPESDESDLGHLQWIKAYQSDRQTLFGDIFTYGSQDIKMLNEYGIWSTYLKRVRGFKCMMTKYYSQSSFVSFRVPLCHKEQRIKGLDVRSSYRFSGKDKCTCVLFAKISNRTKGLTWIYNPLVHYTPHDDKDAMWLSYWPIGTMLDIDDEIHVSIIMGKGLTVRTCGVNLVYANREENCKNDMNSEEVIGGDLSEFKLTTGEYYLCRRDFFKFTTPNWVNMLFDDTINWTELRGWRKTLRFFPPWNAFRDYKEKMIQLQTRVNSETELRKIADTLSTLVGVEVVDYSAEAGIINVRGYVDSMMVLFRLTQFDETAQIIQCLHINPALRKSGNGSSFRMSLIIVISLTVFFDHYKHLVPVQEYWLLLQLHGYLISYLILYLISLEDGYGG